MLPAYTGCCSWYRSAQHPGLPAAVTAPGHFPRTGRMIYRSTGIGDRIPNFSNVGFQFGNEPLPVIWNSNKFQSGRGWSEGDFNCGSFVDGQDFVIWNSNEFQSATARRLCQRAPSPLSQSPYRVWRFGVFGDECDGNGATSRGCIQGRVEFNRLVSPASARSWFGPY